MGKEKERRRETSVGGCHKEPTRCFTSLAIPLRQVMLDGENTQGQGAQPSTSSRTTQLEETQGIHCSWVQVAMEYGSHPKLLCEGTAAASHSPGEGALAVRWAGSSQAAVGCADGRPHCS